MNLTKIDNIHLTDESAEGIQSLHNDDVFQISVYPNPTTDLLLIESKDLSSPIASIELYSAEGKLLYSIFESEAKHQTIFSLSEYSMGIYFLHIRSKKNDAMKKVTKM